MPSFNNGIRRPGFLAGFSGMTPRHSFLAETFLAEKPVKYSGGLGFFGKGFMPQASGDPTKQVLTDAYDKSTGKYYEQSAKCSAGEKEVMCGDVVEEISGCKNVSACCDLVFGPPFCMADCDSNSFLECDDDPNYVEFPDGEWTSCDAVKSAFQAQGIPAHFAEQICDAEDLPAKEAVQTPSQVSQPSAKAPSKASSPPAAAKAPPPPPPKPPPPPCPCAKYGLDRKTEFGPCPKPPASCGKPPNYKCTVPGYGLQNLICGCGKWICPTTKDMLMRMKTAPKRAGGLGQTATDKKKVIPIIGMLGLLALAGLLISGR